MKARENNYDLLRIICMIAVISIHISGNYATAANSASWLEEVYTEHLLCTSLFRTIASFAVPIFIMLSGAFALSEPKNADYKYYYKKELVHIGIPTFVFSILYFVYGLLRNAAVTYLNRESPYQYIMGGGRTDLEIHKWDAILSHVVLVYDDWGVLTCPCRYQSKRKRGRKTIL